MHQNNNEAKKIIMDKQSHVLGVMHHQLSVSSQSVESAHSERDVRVFNVHRS